MIDIEEFFPTETVNVKTKERVYTITIGEKLNDKITELCKHFSKIFLLSDSNVFTLHGTAVLDAIHRSGVPYSYMILNHGEETKNILTVKSIYERMAEEYLDRKSCVVAFGGGVIGDIAGFAAATFMRGIEYIQIPTTLLAMVDSSIGGKTGVDLPHGKNLVGAFYQPYAVISDINFLKTLPIIQFICGMAEIVKYSLIYDATLFTTLERIFVLKDIPMSETILAKIIKRCCEIKADIVSLDEKDTSGIRAILNFGHTLGHALEKLTNYSILHGQAISVGMMYACILSMYIMKFPKKEIERIKKLLMAIGLPSSPIELTEKSISWDSLRQTLNSDKKSITRVPHWILLQKIGIAKSGISVSEDILEETYLKFLNEGEKNVSIK